MRTVLLVLSAVFTIVSTVPYLIDIAKGRTKPRIVSWLNWSLLTGIATAAALSDKQYPSAILTIAATLETLAVVVLGLKYGDRKFEKFDIVCQAGALGGLVLWAVFDNPLVAITATVAIDFLAGLPTYKHAWQKPQEETISAFVLATLGALFALLAINKIQLSGVLYPLYIFVANVIITAELILRSRTLQHIKKD